MLHYNREGISMDIQIIPSTEIPTKSLSEELQELGDSRQRKFLLYRIAGLSVENSLSHIGLKLGSYNQWLNKPVFLALNKRRTELEKNHRAESFKLLRRENQLGAVVIEEKIISTLMAELDSGEYNLIKTSIAKTVYDKLMQDIDAIPIMNVKKLSFIDKMAVLMGGRNGNSETEDSQSTEQNQSQSFKELVQGVDQVQEDSIEEGIIVEGEVINEQVTDIKFTVEEN